MIADYIKGDSNKQPEATKYRASNDSVQNLSTFARLLPRATPPFQHFGIGHREISFQIRKAAGNRIGPPKIPILLCGIALGNAVKYAPPAG
jgi:hypothetical protein